MGKIVMEGHIIREITPLSGKDCFYIADRNKTDYKSGFGACLGTGNLPFG